MKRILILLSIMVSSAVFADDSEACTGISLSAKDGSRVVARTVEWAATPMQCGYVIAPRGHMHQSYTPSGSNGLKYKSVYGYVGIYTEYEPFVVEGVNEAGLSAGLFFFPDYGQYAAYDQSRNDITLCDMQFVSWVLSQFDSIDQVKAALKKINVVTLNHKIGAVHWRIAQPDGRMVVLEFVNGVANFYENKLGVLTNAPGFQWHMTNLNNYLNLRPGSAADYDLKSGITLKPLGHGSGMLGLPGDFTSPSRFIRAAFYQTTAPVLDTGFDTAIQAFHILNNFDIPIGTQHTAADMPKGLPSATQFTAATDLKAMKLYYRTAWNSNIRCIDLMSINFHMVKYQSHPLDNVTVQPVEVVKVK
jgi:choloylglycine hydrolase